MRVERIDDGWTAVYAYTETLDEVIEELSSSGVDLARVEYLSIRNNVFIDGEDFDNIARFVNLRHLMMEGCRNVGMLTPMKKLRGLRTLAPLRSLKGLRTLDIGHCFGISSLLPISGLSITHLAGSYLDRMGIDKCALPSLRCVKCYNTQDMSFLGAFKDTLEELYIVTGGLNTTPLTPSSASKLDLEQLPHLRRLRKLVIDAEDVIVDDKVLQHVKSMRSMKSVSIWGINQVHVRSSDQPIRRTRKTLTAAHREPGSDAWVELRSLCCP